MALENDAYSVLAAWLHCVGWGDGDAVAVLVAGCVAVACGVVVAESGAVVAVIAGGLVALEATTATGVSSTVERGTSVATSCEGGGAVVQAEKSQEMAAIPTTIVRKNWRKGRNRGVDLTCYQGVGGAGSSINLL